MLDKEKDNMEAQHFLVETEKMYLEKAELVLSESINIVYYITCVGMCGCFSYASRFAIWYLYAREFNDSTETEIAWALYGGYFALLIVGLVFPCLSDTIGYDTVIIIKLIIQCIGIFGECIAMNFIFLSCFFILSQVHLLTICLSYIAWILPHQYAIKYTSHFYSLYAITYLIGPISAGILSYFFEYRTIFYINLVYSVLMLIFALKFILKSQKKIETQQLSLKQQFVIDSNNEKYVFPILKQNQNDASSLTAFWKSISKFQWFQLINALIQNSLTQTTEAVFVAYYAVFIIDNFDGNDMIATGQLFMICLGFIIGNALVPIIVNKESNRNRKYVILIVSELINIVCLIILFPLITNVHIFWILNIFIGLFLGLSVMITEVIILHRQPTHHVGKIGAIKNICRDGIKAVTVVVTGLLYATNNQYAIIYTVTICYTISLCFSIILWARDINLF
eukprot:520104_1